MSKTFLTIGLGLILLAIGLGSLATIRAIENVAPNLHPSITLKNGTRMVTYTETVTCHGRQVTVTTTCSEGESAEACFARHQAAVAAALAAMGC